MERNVTEDTCREAFSEAERQFSILYWAEVREIAQDAIDEYPDDEDAQNDHIWERCDNHHWLIYTVWHSRILGATQNDDAWEEFGELDADKATQQMAFCAFWADVREELSELREKETEEE